MEIKKENNLFNFECIKWTGINKNEVEEFCVFEGKQKCFFSNQQTLSLWLIVDNSHWRIEIGDYLFKIECGVFFYRENNLFEN